MQEWTKWSMQGRVSLHALAKALGLPSSKDGDIEGKDVAKAYVQGKIKEICEYCAKDVELTRKIYKRMTFSK
jgi:predicted PolB exonuclease-like 3'-5' exonuclease